MVTKFLQFVAVTAMLATLFGAARAEAAVPPSTTALSAGEVLVDEAGGHVFATATDSVAVFDLAGQRVGTIADQFGAVDLVLRDRTLYVLAGNVNRINTVDADTFAVTGGWDLPGVTESWQMTWAGGAFWITYGDQWSDGIAKFVPTTGDLTLGLGGTIKWRGAIEGTSSPARIYVLDRGSSPSKVHAYDISSGVPVALVTSPHTNDCGNGRELALAPSGTSVWTACGAPYTFNQWDRTTLGAPTAAYPSTNYPDAVTVSSDGTILVGGTSSSSGKDVWVYDVNRPSALKAIEAGPGLLLEGMLATTANGDRVYAVIAGGTLKTFDFRPAITQPLAAVPAETETEIAVTGKELADVTTATVDGAPASVRVASDTLAYVTVPALEGGTYPVTVTSRWGTSAATDTARVEVVAGVPAAPAAPTVTATPSFGVSLAWSEPGDGGAPITSYVVRTYAGDDEVALDERTVTGTSTTIDGLVAETGYRFTVAAANEKGTGAFSERSELASAGLPAIAPFTALAPMIDRLYQDVVLRAPETVERDAWLAALRAGEATPVDLVLALRASEDNQTNVDAVARLYQAYFGRPADASGLTYWSHRRRAGTSLTAISNSFARSSEFRRTYANLTNREFVTLVYTRVLGRAGDTGGITFWTGQLDRGRKTRGAVMIGFSEASEYVRTTTAEVAASVTPILLLGKAPARADYQASVAALDGGSTVADLVGAILASPAFAARVDAV